MTGKRVALVGFPPPQAAELTQIIMDAEGFTRPLSPAQVDPASDILKPFELILLDVESSAGTAWLDKEKSARVQDRCIAVGDVSALLPLASHSFREYCPRSSSGEELLLRCTLALRPRSHASHSLGSTPSASNASASTPSASTPSASNPSLSTPAGSTVVLADDDTSVTSIVRRALERNGLTCELAANGKDALMLIEKLKPCAAVLDVHMPTIDGFEVLSRTRSMAEVAQTRIILLTGSEQESDVIRGFTLGADDYVCKPFNPMELTIRLMRVLGRL